MPDFETGLLLNENLLELFVKFEFGVEDRVFGSDTESLVEDESGVESSLELDLGKGGCPLLGGFFAVRLSRTIVCFFAGFSVEVSSA